MSKNSVNSVLCLLRSLVFLFQVRNLSFVFDERLTVSDQITSLFKAYYNIIFVNFAFCCSLLSCSL